MKGVLVVGHGSRQKSMGRILEAVSEMARAELPELLMEVACMEFGEKDIPSGLNALVVKGVREIAVVPYFLFEGIHVSEDIPKAIDEFKESHPDIKITMGRPLGADSRLAAILADRIKECI